MSQARFDELRRVYPSAQKVEEGQRLLALLPRLCVQTSEGPRTVDALLYPHRHDTGYTTRLFFSEPLPSTLSFTAYNVCGARWYACSWQDVPETLPWPEMVANHLRAIK